MIRFTEANAKDTFSYRDLSFKFEQGLSAIEGANGTSKSSLFLTLQQGLFNRNAKGCKVDEVNNVITGQPYEIVIPFIKNNDEYRVVNSRKEGRIDIFKNGKNIALKRIPDNLQLIQEILGCDFAMFCDLTYQNKDSSLDLLETGTDKGRKQFINRVLRLAEIDEQLARMKEKDKELRGAKIPFLRSQIQTFEAALGTELEVGEEEPVEQYRIAKKILDDEIELLKEEKRCIDFKLKDLGEREARRRVDAEVQQKIMKVKLELARLSEFDIIPAEVENEIDKAREEETVLWVSTSNLEADLRRAAENEAKRLRYEYLQEEIAQIDTGKLSKKELQDLIDADTKFLAGETVILKQLRAKIDELEAAMTSGDCPTCGTKVPRETFEAEVIRLKEEGRWRKANLELRKDVRDGSCQLLEQHERKEKLEREMDRLIVAEDLLDVEATKAELAKQREELLKLQEYIRDRQDLLHQYHEVQSLQYELATLKTKLTDEDPYEDLAELHEKYTETAASIATDLQDTQARQSTLFEDLTAIETRNATIRARREVNRQIAENNAQLQLQIDSARKCLEEMECRADLVKEWLGILGNKGYRVAKIDRFLRSLNATMHKYSQMICEGRIRASFFITPEGEIDFTIMDDAKSMDYTLWSGGEKARVRLVTLFAVLELLEVMGSVSFNVLCLDEVFDQLDADGKAGLFRVLEYLKARNKALYVIAHSELALDLVYDAVITASKNPDGTTQLKQ